MKVHRLSVLEWEGNKRYEMACGRKFPKSVKISDVLSGKCKTVVTEWVDVEEDDRCFQCRVAIGEIGEDFFDARNQRWKSLH